MTKSSTNRSNISHCTHADPSAASEWTEAFLGACLNYEILDPSADGTALNTANIAVQGLTDYLQWECNGVLYPWQPLSNYWFCNGAYPLYDPTYIFGYYLPGLP